MNNCVCSGYLQKKTKYIRNEQGEMEFCFYLNVYCSKEGKTTAIPFKCKGRLADECHVKLKAGDYMEVVGEQFRPTSQKHYILVHSLSYKKPRGNNVVQIRTTEFLEIFDVSNVLDRLNDKKDKNGKNK